MNCWRSIFRTWKPTIWLQFAILLSSIGETVLERPGRTCSCSVSTLCRCNKTRSVLQYILCYRLAAYTIDRAFSADGFKGGRLPARPLDPGLCKNIDSS
ncbi:hypothetical protein PGTUg99_014228 [Puccinia graminis f. sp. tritici]|uniref:Secreted protein n=1 Tax=Puccinia graminis f. sp. tritici TaxID=56615 RepID=A0A5B0SF58_PUCGR|nr:hypothetical protein PGTUg99_014228 [Puccinia graminis f. sp. tritici]